MQRQPLVHGASGGPPAANDTTPRARAIVRLRDTYAPNVALSYHISVWGNQDNRTEWLLDETARTRLAAYRDAGVVAFLFGGGASGVTCACDAKRDGMTNPAAFNGNNIVSEAGAGSPSLMMRGATPTLVTPYAADDDGGYFRWRAWQYYTDGPMALTGGSPPGAPTNLRIIR